MMTEEMRIKEMSFDRVIKMKVVITSFLLTFELHKIVF